MITYTDRLERIIAQISSGLYEKENSVRLVLLSFLAGESTFLLGEPGTAKSLIARRVSEAFVDPTEEEKEHGVIKFFDYLMSRFSQPDELFGPVSIRQLKDDNYERKTEYYLPKAQFAFLDEIWKANPAIQNALLTILNEHLFRNGKNLLRVPLLGFVSASNELPAQGQGLEAIFDRFLIRVLERPVQDEENFFNMISGKAEMTVSVDDRLSAEDMDIIRKQSESIRLSDESKCVISNVRKLLTLRNEEPNREDKEKYVISDRRWKKIAGLMRVSAYCNGRDETDLLDAMLIANCIWSTETQENEVRDIITKAIVREDIITSIEKKVQLFEDSIHKLFYIEKPIVENGNYKCENRNNGEIVWISTKKDDYYDKYLINNTSSNLSFDDKSYIYANSNDSFKVLFETKEIDDVKKLEAFTKEQDKQFDDIKGEINVYEKGLSEQLDYWRECSNVFVSKDLRQPVINALCHQKDVLESLLFKSKRIAGAYHIMLRKNEVPHTIKLCKTKEKSAKELEEKAIQAMISSSNPVTEKNESKVDCIVFNDKEGTALLIPDYKIDSIYKKCQFYDYKGGRRYSYTYNPDLMAVEERVYGHGAHSYNLCITVNRQAIKLIVEETNAKYSNLQSEINELLNNGRDQISKDPFLDDGIKKELVNQLNYKSYLPNATTHLEDINKYLEHKSNTKAKLDNIKEIISSNQSRDRNLLTLLRSMLGGDK